MWCNALGTVAGLYEKLGYVKNGGTNVYVRFHFLLALV